MKYFVPLILSMFCITVYAGDSSILAPHPGLKEEAEKWGISSDSNPTSESNELFNLDIDSNSTELPDYLQPAKRKADSWEVSDGKLIVTNSGERRLAFGELDDDGNIISDAWTDYTLTVEANLLDNNGYGIYYRSDGEDNVTGYCFQYDPGYANSFIVRRVTAGKEASPIQRIKMANVMDDDFTVYNEPHKIEIEVVGDNHVIKVDNIEVLSFSDTWQRDTDSGAAGIRAWAKSNVEFSDIKVDPIESSATP